MANPRFHVYVSGHIAGSEHLVSKMRPAETGNVKCGTLGSQKKIISSVFSPRLLDKARF